MTAKTYLGKLNAEDLNSVLQQHGLNQASSVSSESGKSEFDEEYYKMKPPPLKINQKNIVTISAGANETVQSLALKCKNEGVTFNQNHNKQGFKNRQAANGNIRRTNRNKRGKTNPGPTNNFTNINKKQRPQSNTRQVQTRDEQLVQIVPNAKSPNNSVLTNTKLINGEASTSKAPVYVIPTPSTNFNTNSTINDEASTSKAPIPIPRSRSFKSLDRKQLPVVSRETENIPNYFGKELQLPDNSAEKVVAPPENKLSSGFPVRPIRGSFRSKKTETRQVVIKKESVETIGRTINSNSTISNVSNSSASANINNGSIRRQNGNMPSEIVVYNNYRQESLIDKLLSFICCC